MSLLHSLGTIALRQLPAEAAHLATLRGLELGFGPCAPKDLGLALLNAAL